MMDYALFKELVPQRIKEFLPPIFHGYTPSVRSVNKVNEKKDAFCLLPPGNDPNVAIPTLYLDDLYEIFSEHEDLDEVLRMIASIIMQWSGVRMPRLAGFKLEEHTDRIVANLIDTERNRDLLDTIPHSPCMDMSIIYRLIADMNDDGIQSMIITDEIMHKAGLTREDLARYAEENTCRIFPFRIYEENEDGVAVITNHSEYYGATAMLYEEDMQALARRIGGDFFIMPTSVHEFFAIPTCQADPDHLIRMLAAGNENITRVEDRLSNTIYRYLAAEGRIEKIASYEEKNGAA